MLAFSRRMRTALFLAAALLLAAAAYAQASKVVGVNPAVLDTDAKVLAKIWVSDLEQLSREAGLALSTSTVVVGNREVRVARLVGRGLALQGPVSGAGGVLYYSGPARLLKALVDSPYVISIFVKVIPEVPPSEFFKDAVEAAEAGPGTPLPDLPVMREIIGASRVEQLYGVNGTGVVIAVVDTGVDYGHPDLQDALAWLIAKADGGEVIASKVWQQGSILYYTDLQGRQGQLPSSSVASLEPLALDADESQVILLRGFTPSNNVLAVSGMTFTVIDGPTMEFVKATCNYDVTGLVSRSGVYRFGMTSLYIPWSPLANQSGYVNVGVVMYDPELPGVYTAARVDINRNCRFADDPELRYVGNRLIVDSLQSPKVSLGVAGGYFYDWGLWLDTKARFYPGWDLAGNYLSIFYDFESHGTACSSVAAGRGKATYNLGLLGPQRLKGIASGAKVLGVKGLQWGMVEAGMMWVAGFSVDPDGRWYWTGQKRGHVISNSWGISTFIYDYAGFGYDLESAVIDGLATPRFLDGRYPGIVIVQAGGNGGYGFSTITSPGAAVGALTVGAATSGHYWQALGTPFRGLRFGDIISWSLRGPTLAGYTKPNVVNIGAFGISAYPVGWGATVGHPGQDWDIFGGTSQATPLTAGVAALVLSAISSKVDPAAVDPAFVRQVISSTASDIGYTPFTAGHGLVNATAAVTAARAYYGLPAAKVPAALFSGSPSVIYSGGAWDFQWRVNIPMYFGYLVNNVLTDRWVSYIQSNFIPSQAFPLTYIYLGRLQPGLAGQAVLSVQNPTDGTMSMSVTAVELRPFYRATVTLNIPVRTLGGYFTMSALGFDEAALKSADLVVFRMAYPFSAFDPEFDYLENTRPVLWVFGWTDLNGDNLVQVNELTWYNYGYQRGTAVEVPVARLGARMAPGERLVLRIDVRPVRSPYRAQVPVMVEVVAYRRVPASDVSVSPSTAQLGPRGTVNVYVTARPSPDAAPTAFERLLVVTLNGTGYVVPLTYTVSRQLSMGAPLAVTEGRSDSWYNASEVRGANDWGWRYESGDWRAYYVRTAGLARGVLVDFRWTCPNTSMVAYVLTGDGFFAGHFPNQGYSYHLNPGGGRFNWTGVAGTARILTMASSSFAVPIQVPGFVYTTMSASYPVGPRDPFFQDFTVLARTSLFGGCSTGERIRGTVTAFRSALDPLPIPLAPVLSFSMSQPPISYSFAVKSAYVLGGGLVLPGFVQSADLTFRMVYVRIPAFVDFLAILYSPQYATYVRYRNTYRPYPFYFEEGISTG